MNRVYLIDTENIGKCYLKNLNLIDKDDLIIHLDNQNSLNSNLKLNIKELINISSRLEQIKIIETVNGTPNSLDFILTTLIGHLITVDPFKEYIVVSKDSGYDTMIDFWKKKAIKIERHLEIGLDIKDKPKNIRKNKVDLIFKKGNSLKNGLTNIEKLRELIKFRNNESIVDIATLITEHSMFEDIETELKNMFKYDKNKKIEIIKNNWESFKH